MTLPCDEQTPSLDPLLLKLCHIHILVHKGSNLVPSNYKTVSLITRQTWCIKHGLAGIQIHLEERGRVKQSCSSFLEAFANVLERKREGEGQRSPKIMSRTQKVIFTICLGFGGSRGQMGQQCRREEFWWPVWLMSLVYSSYTHFLLKQQQGQLCVYWRFNQMSSLLPSNGM